MNKTILARVGCFSIITIIYVSLLLGFSGAVEPTNAVLAAYTSSDRVIEKSFDVRPGGLLSLESSVGKVRIEGWDLDEVRVKIEVGGHSRYIDDIEFHIESSVDGVKIRADIPGSRSFFRNLGRNLNINYSVMVPFEYDLNVRTSGGGISINKVDGDIDARTSGGGVNAEQVSGIVNLATSGGGIGVSGAKGDVSLRTSGGSIVVDGLYGKLDARTSGGPIRLSNIDAEVDARTSGGGITLTATGENRGISLRTSGGSITANLPGSIGAHLSAKTSGGRVHTDFPITIQGSMSGSSIEGTINQGGPEIVLRTSGGSIRINKQ